MKNDPSEVRREEFRIGAEKIGWKTRDSRRATKDPAILRGVGVGAAVWYNTGEPGAAGHGDAQPGRLRRSRARGPGSGHGRADGGRDRGRRGARPAAREGLGPDRRHADAVRARRPAAPRRPRRPRRRSGAPRTRPSEGSPSRGGEGVEGPRRVGRPIDGGFVTSSADPAKQDFLGRGLQAAAGFGRRRHGRPGRKQRGRLEAFRRAARSSPRSRSTPRPARSASSGSSPSTTAVSRSTP